MRGDYNIIWGTVHNNIIVNITLIAFHFSTPNTISFTRQSVNHKHWSLSLSPPWAYDFFPHLPYQSPNLASIFFLQSSVLLTAHTHHFTLSCFFSSPFFILSPTLILPYLSFFSSSFHPLKSSLPFFLMFSLLPLYVFCYTANYPFSISFPYFISFRLLLLLPFLFMFVASSPNFYAN